jgi:hypothetical protein
MTAETDAAVARAMGGGPRVQTMAQPIEVILADGGHVIVTIEDAATRIGSDGDDLVAVLVQADGSERDLERAIQAEATELGLDFASSASDHPTVIVVRRAAP